MKTTIILIIFVISNVNLQSQTEINTQIINGFYQVLWFTNNTDNYAKYVADESIVHDIGDWKGVTEPAIEKPR